LSSENLQAKPIRLIVIYLV